MREKREESEYRNREGGRLFKKGRKEESEDRNREGGRSKMEEDGER